MKKILQTTAILILLSATENAFAKKVDFKNSPKTNRDLPDIIENLLPCVVTISASRKNEAARGSDFFEDLTEVQKSQMRSKAPNAIGSGFFISRDGLIVTNYHVIEKAGEINISTHDDVKYKAKLITFDEKSDIALLKVEADEDFAFADFGNSDNVRVGETAIVVGNPYDLGSSVSVGIISARNRNVAQAGNNDLLQTDAAINKGNSGGPMFNASGEVIGITSAIFSPSGAGVGIGFATTSNQAGKVIKQLQEVGRVTRGWIGVSIQEIDAELAASVNSKKGVFVNEVVEGSPADDAGVNTGDVILSFDNKIIKDVSDLPRFINNYPINKTAKIKVWRGSRERILDIKVEANPESENKTLAKKWLIGLELKEVKNEVRVSAIKLRSEAEKKKVSIGDVILSIDQKEISSIPQMQNLVEQAKNEGRKLLMIVKRGAKKHAFTLNSR